MDVLVLHHGLSDRLLPSFAPKIGYKVINLTARRQSNMDFDYKIQ